MESAEGDPLSPGFLEHFTQREGSQQYNNRVDCCMYDSYDGRCYSSDWEGDNCVGVRWEGMGGLSFFSCEVGMLLDLDEGTLSVYINGRKLGVMKRGLAGQYCWVIAMLGGQVAIKRGTVSVS